MTPLISAESTSSSTRGAWVPGAARPGSDRGRAQPICITEMSLNLSSPWWSRSRSCSSQNTPRTAAASEASAASWALRMDVLERQVAPDIADVAKIGQQLAHDRLGLTAVWALEVPVLDNGHRGLGGSAQVVALGIDRYCQVDRGSRRCRVGRAGESAWEAGRWLGRPARSGPRRRAPRYNTPSFASSSSTP